MKRLAIFLIAGVLSGCASVPANPWQGLTTETDPATRPIDCGRFPLPTQSTETTITYDKEGANKLEAYRECSEANQDIADENADAVDSLKVARKGLTEAGQSQRNIADMRLQMLEDERRHHLIQSVGYWVVILGLAL